MEGRVEQAVGEHRIINGHVGCKDGVRSELHAHSPVRASSGGLVYITAERVESEQIQFS